MNSDRNEPWNALSSLPTQEELYKTVEVYERLGRAKEALALLAGRSVVIPNPTLLIDGIVLQENGAFDIDYLVNLYREIKETDEGIRPPFCANLYPAGRQWTQCRQASLYAAQGGRRAKREAK